MAWWKLCVIAAGVVNALVLQPARIAHDAAAANVMRAIRAAGRPMEIDMAVSLLKIA